METKLKNIEEKVEHIQEKLEEHIIDDNKAFERFEEKITEIAHRLEPLEQLSKDFAEFLAMMKGGSIVAKWIVYLLLFIGGSYVVGVKAMFLKIVEHFFG